MRDDQKFEFTMAEKTSGKRHAMSGAQTGNADASTLVFGIECKSPVKDVTRFTMTADIWYKAERQCMRHGNLPTVAIQLNGLTLVGLELEQLQAICSQSCPELLLEFNFVKETACHAVLGTLKDSFVIEQSKYEEYQEIADLSHKRAAWIVELGKTKQTRICFIDLDTFVLMSRAADKHV
jgi:hypothetical protein